MHNVNPEGYGVGGSTGRSENVGQYFLSGNKKRISQMLNLLLTMVHKKKYLKYQALSQVFQHMTLITVQCF